MGKPWRWLGYLVIGLLGVFAALGSHLTFNQGPAYSTSQLAPTSSVVGEAAPLFTLVTAQGRPAPLAQWRGRWVVLVFAAPGTPAAPPLRVLARARPAAARRVVWLVVNTDPTLTAAPAFAARIGGAVPSATYLTGSLVSLAAVWSAYGVSVSVVAQHLVYTAAVYVLGPHGHVRFARVLNLTNGSPATINAEARSISRQVPMRAGPNNSQNKG